MARTRNTALFFAGILFVSGCAHVSPPRASVQRFSDKTYPPTDPTKVELHVEAPPRPSETIAEVTVSMSVSAMTKSQTEYVSQFGEVNKALQAEAAKLGADAVVSLRRRFAPSPFAHVKATYSGLAVKFTGPAPEAAEQAGPEAGFSSELLASEVDKPNYGLGENKDYYALVVGIEKYSALPEATFAERDASSVREHLIALGVPPRNIRFLMGPQAGRAALEKYVESWLPSNAGENSRVFVYFSGHGAPDPKTGLAYLVPWDGDAKFLENTAYPVKRLYERLNGLKAKEIIVVMDACFSGAGGRSVLAKGTRPLVTKVDSGLDSAGKLVVLSASASDEITGMNEEQKHGLFTYYFLKGLNGEAKGSDGGLTLKALYDYIAPRVKAEARRENRDQTPQLMSASLGEKARIRLR